MNFFFHYQIYHVRFIAAKTLTGKKSFFTLILGCLSFLLNYIFVKRSEVFIKVTDTLIHYLCLEVLTSVSFSCTSNQLSYTNLPTCDYWSNHNTRYDLAGHDNPGLKDTLNILDYWPTHFKSFLTSYNFPCTRQKEQ